MPFFVTRLCFDRSRLYFLLMSTENFDRANIGGSIGGGWALPEALVLSFASLYNTSPCEALMEARQFPVSRSTARPIWSQTVTLPRERF